MRSDVAMRALDQHKSHGLPLPVMGEDRLENHLVWEAVAIRSDILEVNDGLEKKQMDKLENAKREAIEKLRAKQATIG